MLIIILFAVLIGFAIHMGNSSQKSNQNKVNESQLIATDSVINLSDSEKYMKYLTDSKRNKIVADYFNGMDKIKKNASLLYQSGITTGEPIDELIEQCYENIAQYDKWKKIANAEMEELPLNVPAFKRLAIIYDRQSKYDLELEVCKQAIARGLDMGMEARAAKCAKKLGIDLNEDTIQAMMK